jgi:hypothetical protein
MSQLLHIKSKPLQSGIVFVLAALGIISFARGNGTGFLVSNDMPTPNVRPSFAPVTYGLPETIGGYRILAVHTLENTACMLAGSYRLVLQATEPTVEDFLGSTPGVDSLQQTLARLDIPQPTRWELSFVGPGVTTEFILSETEKWNIQFSDGCVRLGPIEGTLTPR